MRRAWLELGLKVGLASFLAVIAIDAGNIALPMAIERGSYSLKARRWRVCSGTTRAWGDDKVEMAIHETVIGQEGCVKGLAKTHQTVTGRGRLLGDMGTAALPAILGGIPCSVVQDLAFFPRVKTSRWSVVPVTFMACRSPSPCAPTELALSFTPPLFD